MESRKMTTNDYVKGYYFLEIRTRKLAMGRFVSFNPRLHFPGEVFLWLLQSAM